MDDPNIRSGIGAHPGEQGYGWFENWMQKTYGRVYQPEDQEFAAAQAGWQAHIDRGHAYADRLKRRGRWHARLTAPFWVLRALWQSVWHMGMYSSDPTLARMAMVHTAQEQLQLQRQISARQRVEGQISEEARLKTLGHEIGKGIAHEMLAEMDRRHESAVPDA